MYELVVQLVVYVFTPKVIMVCEETALHNMLLLHNNKYKYYSQSQNMCWNEHICVYLVLFNSKEFEMCFHDDRFTFSLFPYTCNTCLLLSCIGLCSRMSTICSIWCAPHERLPAPQSPPTATVTSLRRTRWVPQWVNHTLLTHFLTFHQQNTSFHHVVRCHHPHLSEGVKKMWLTSFKMDQKNSLTFSVLFTAPSRV